MDPGWSEVLYAAAALAVRELLAWLSRILKRKTP